MDKKRLKALTKPLKKGDGITIDQYSEEDSKIYGEDTEKALKLYKVNILQPTEFLKAKPLPVGSIRTHGGKKVQKTAQGWKPVKRGAGEGAPKGKPSGDYAPKAHKGVYYFGSSKEAKSWAEQNEWPTDRIMQYGRGWAVQSGKSGNYAGPGETPREWKGTVKHPGSTKTLEERHDELTAITNKLNASPEDMLEYYKVKKQLFDLGIVKPSKIVGGGYKNARKVAGEWLDRTIAEQSEKVKGTKKEKSMKHKMILGKSRVQELSDLMKALPTVVRIKPEPRKPNRKVPSSVKSYVKKVEAAFEVINGAVADLVESRGLETAAEVIKKYVEFKECFQWKVNDAINYPNTDLDGAEPPEAPRDESRIKPKKLK